MGNLRKCRWPSTSLMLAFLTNSPARTCSEATERFIAKRSYKRCQRPNAATGMSPTSGRAAEAFRVAIVTEKSCRAVCFLRRRAA
jgi:hypothetical protein